MTRLSRRLLALVIVVFSAGAAPEPAVTFLGWRGVAEASVPRRMAANFYRLRASVKWATNAAPDPNRYRVAIDPPAGRPGASYPLAPGDQPGASGLTVWVPVELVRDLPASKVILSARVIDSITGETVSNGALTATIDQFPNPGDLVPPAPTEFGWGMPLKPVEGGGQILSRKPYVAGETDLNEGPQGLQFVRIFKQGDHPGFFASTTEVTLDQVSSLVKDKGYNPNLRPGEFSFSADSPAIGVSPAIAEAYLTELGKLDGYGSRYRLPTREEWLRLAKAGKSTRFWWGDDPDDELAKLGANFKGLERPRVGSTREDEADVIRPTATGGISQGKFVPSPWGFWHTFGNVAEWATDPNGGPPWLLGGTFRTDRDKANFRAEDLEIQLKSPAAYDPEANPFAGIRPVVEITSEQGVAAAQRLLLVDSGRFKNVSIAFDPETATATLTGSVFDSLTRKRADEALRPLWFLAAVENQLEVEKPPVPLGRVASISGEGDSKGMSLSYMIDDRIYRVPVSIFWAEKLPVEGSTIWINVFRTDGSFLSASRIRTVEIGRSSRLDIVIDGAKMKAAGLAIDAPVQIALSLGKDPAVSTNDPGIVSEVVTLRWRLDPGRAIASGLSIRARPAR